MLLQILCMLLQKVDLIIVRAQQGLGNQRWEIYQVSNDFPEESTDYLNPPTGGDRSSKSRIDLG